MTTILSLLAALGLLLSCYLLYGQLLSPAREDLHLVIPVRSSAPRLEHTLNSLLWLYRAGLLRVPVLLEDHGLDPEGRDRVARICAQPAYQVLLSQDRTSL